MLSAVVVLFIFGVTATYPVLIGATHLLAYPVCLGKRHAPASLASVSALR